MTGFYFSPDHLNLANDQNIRKCNILLLRKRRCMNHFTMTNYISFQLIVYDFYTDYKIDEIIKYSFCLRMFPSVNLPSSHIEDMYIRSCYFCLTFQQCKEHDIRHPDSVVIGYVMLLTKREYTSECTSEGIKSIQNVKLRLQFRTVVFYYSNFTSDR